MSLNETQYYTFSIHVGIILYFKFLKFWQWTKLDCNRNCKSTRLQFNLVPGYICSWVAGVFLPGLGLDYSMWNWYCLELLPQENRSLGGTAQQTHNQATIYKREGGVAVWPSPHSSLHAAVLTWTAPEIQSPSRTVELNWVVDFLKPLNSSVYHLSLRSPEVKQCDALCCPHFNCLSTQHHVAVFL